MTQFKVLVILLLLPFIAQTQQVQLTNPLTSKGRKIATSLPMSQLIDNPNPVRNRAIKDGYVPKKDWILHQKLDPTAKPIGPDPAWQKEYPTAKQNGQRAVDNNWNGSGYTGVNPADPSLDVGPNHVVQMINNSSSSRVRIYDKTGTELQSILISTITGISGNGDPIVIYDQLADRWLLSEFFTANDQMIVAVSVTSDPTGAYNIYEFDAVDFPDYPKYSIWPDGYYVTTNEGNQAVYAFERDVMLAGGTNPGSVRFTMPDFQTIGFQTATPVSLSGTTLPPAGTPQYIMRMADDAWTTITTDDDRLEVFEFDVDWNNTANSTLSGPTNYITLPFDTDLCGYTSFSCMDQPGTTTKLDPLREVLMNRIFYRNFGDHESIVCNHVTDVDDTDKGGIRWYELQRTNASWSIYQQGTYAPNDNDDRWMAGIAINADGSIGLAYNVSGSSSTYPSIRYTGRLSTDPLGMMTIPETTIIDGTASNSSNRYGDYNCLVVDPSNEHSFWFTGKYNTSSNWSTRITEFSFGPVVPNVKFDQSNLTVIEETDTLTGCIGYKDYNINFGISSAPIMPADITINYSGSAKVGINQDVEFFPNQFTLDSNTLSKEISIRIYDDRSIESQDSLILDFILDANGGNAILGSVNQTFMLLINDNDLISSGVVTVVHSEDFDPSPTDITITDNGSTNDTWEFVSTARSGNSLDGTPFAFVDSDAAGNGTTLNEIMDFPVIPLVSGLTATLELDEYYNSYSDDTELAYIDVYDGNTWQRILTHVSVDGDIGSWASPNHVNIDITTYANPNFQIRIGYEAEWDYYWAIDNIVVSQESLADIATTITTVSDTFYFGHDSEIIAVDENGDIIAKLEGLDTLDYGCAVIRIDRAGTDATNLLLESDTTKGYTDKTVYLEFLDGDFTDRPYKMTLYYSDTEKSGWESATTNNWMDSTSSIVRLDSLISTSDTTSNYEIGLTVDKDMEFGSHFVSAIFSNGGGGFGVSAPEIPIPCLSFLHIAGIPESGTYLTKDSIDSDALIDSSKNVTFSSGLNIELLSDFQVDTGAIFTAIIGGCGVSPMSIAAGQSLRSQAQNNMPVQKISNTTAQKSKLKKVEEHVKVLFKDNSLYFHNLSTTNHVKPIARIAFYKNKQKIFEAECKIKPTINGTYSGKIEIPNGLDIDKSSALIQTEGYDFEFKIIR